MAAAVKVGAADDLRDSARLGHADTETRAERARRLTAAEKLVGLPTSQWHGQCFYVASKLAPAFGGIAVYGHWLGKISPKATFWEKKREIGFAQHGWIVLPNEKGRYGVECETIVDPTRWSFEAKGPYIWRGKNDGTYDEGGNRVRMDMRHSRYPDGPPDDDGEREPITLNLSCDEVYQRLKRVLGYSDFHDFSNEYPFLCPTDAVWVANTDPAVIGWFYVAEVYEALARAGMHAHIPTDNWKMVDRRFGLKDVEQLTDEAD